MNAIKHEKKLESMFVLASLLSCTFSFSVDFLLVNFIEFYSFPVHTFSHTLMLRRFTQKISKWWRVSSNETRQQAAGFGMNYRISVKNGAL